MFGKGRIGGFGLFMNFGGLLLKFLLFMLRGGGGFRGLWYILLRFVKLFRGFFLRFLFYFLLLCYVFLGGNLLFGLRLFLL